MPKWFGLICALCVWSSTMAEAATPTELVKKALGQHKGCFLLYQMKTKKLVIKYGGQACQRRHSPCSSFKVPHALIALQTGVVKDPKKPMRWDKKKRWLKAWNRDHSLWTSMRHSVVWVYQRIAPKIGRARMKHWLKKLSYGDGRVVGDMRTFWLRRSLTISAMEQLAFFKRMAAETLPFKRQHVRRVKAMMVLKKNKKGDVLQGKTGSAYQAGKWKLGWFVGIVKRKGQRYVFVTKIRKGHKPRGPLARKITYKILKGLDLFPK